MISFDRVSFTYPNRVRPVLDDVTLSLREGELTLVVGSTGSGKSTLLRAMNGLVPHFSGGLLTGHVRIDGMDTRDHPPRDLAATIGFVGQDPAATFVTDVVEDELAYGMENLGLAPAVMRRRVEDTLDLLGLADARTYPLATLSGGQQQRVAIGAVLTTHPRMLVLDEPTSALDPAAAEDVLAALQRLVHDVGLGVVLAEHRLERVLQYADRVVTVTGNGVVEAASPGEAMRTAPVAPPVVELGRVAGWAPLPLSIRDARRQAGELRERLLTVAAAPHPRPEATAPIARVTGLGVRYSGVPALDRVDLQIAPAEVVGLMGRNGAGKSTLLACVAGLRRPDDGRVEVAGREPHGRPARDVVADVALVPQDPGLLLYAETVAAECATADREGRLERGTTAAVLASLTADGWPLDPAAHPRDLSEGQRLTLALAVVLAPAPPLLLLDEPTRGLDYGAKARLAALLRRLAGAGSAVVLATHDVELAADVCTRVIVLAGGEVVADGPTAEVVTQSPVFAPQVAKVLAPGPWLTVADVVRDLEAAAS